MSVEFIGLIATRKASEIHAAEGPAIDRDYVRHFAQAHEAAGFDRVLVAYHSTGPDAFLVTSYAAAVTERIGFMLAHRPGFVEPTLAARKLATLDQFSGGRLAVHIISGGDDAEQRRDGDFLGHDERYARTDEYLDVLRRIWTSDQSFDHSKTNTKAGDDDRDGEQKGSRATHDEQSCRQHGHEHQPDEQQSLCWVLSLHLDYAPAMALIRYQRPDTVSSPKEDAAYRIQLRLRT